MVTTKRYVVKREGLVKGKYWGGSDVDCLHSFHLIYQHLGWYRLLGCCWPPAPGYPAPVSNSRHTQTQPRNLKKPAALSASSRKAWEAEGRGGSHGSATELTQLVTATTAHLYQCVREGEKTRDWEKAGEEQPGKTHRGRPVHSQMGLILSGYMLLLPLHLRKLQKTPMDYINIIHTQYRFIHNEELFIQVQQKGVFAMTWVLVPEQEVLGHIYVTSMGLTAACLLGFCQKHGPKVTYSSRAFAAREVAFS